MTAAQAHTKLKQPLHYIPFYYSKQEGKLYFILWYVKRMEWQGQLAGQAQKMIDQK